MNHLIWRASLKDNLLYLHVYNTIQFNQAYQLKPVPPKHFYKTYLHLLNTYCITNKGSFYTNKYIIANTTIWIEIPLDTLYLHLQLRAVHLNCKIYFISA